LAVIAATRRWLEAAVIGLNLCPFARAPLVGGRIRFSVSRAEMEEALLDDLQSELRRLVAASPEECETSLLIHPHVLADFADYNDFLDAADKVLKRWKLVGHIQIASFHPDYQFSGTLTDDMGNFTNRSPYPMLHRLREDSIEHALAAYLEPDRIYKRNIETLRALGRAGWDRMALGPASDE